MKTLKEMEEMGDEPFRELVRKTVEDIFVRCTNEGNRGREIDVFFSDGYDTPTHRTIFFCITGSPNKFYGYIMPETNFSREKNRLVEVGMEWVGHTNFGNFKTDWINHKIRIIARKIKGF